MDGHFLFNVIYKDEITYKVVGAAVKVLGMIVFSLSASTFHPYVLCPPKLTTENKVKIFFFRKHGIELNQTACTFTDSKGRIFFNTLYGGMMTVQQESIARVASFFN